MRSDGVWYGMIYSSDIFTVHMHVHAFPKVVHVESDHVSTEVMDHAREIHKDVLVGLISHPGLRIRKDLARYALAEHILKPGYAWP